MSKAKVYFVGAGPGDPMLITAKGGMLISQADCIIYDGLANSELLECVRPGVEMISVAKRSGHHSYKQSEINALLLEKAKQHRIIVRLKGGDPCLFGRAVEEVKTCIDAGVDFEIVPGITSGIAAAEYAGIFLTDREHTSAVCFLTGREAEGKDHTDLDWQNLAGFRGSLVLYMGMSNLDSIAKKLIENGKSPTTPTAVIHHATYPQQKVVKASLTNIVRECEQRNISAPSIVIIGESAKGIEGADWFSRQPLSGKKIVITRDFEGNRSFASQLRLCGACPIYFDSIEIISLADSPAAREAVSSIRDFDWILFTSANGIRHTFSVIHQLGLDSRIFADTKIACIGDQTANELRFRGLRADYIPDSFTSTTLAQGLSQRESLKDKKILLLRSEIAPDDLPNTLQDKGAVVRDVSIYTVRPRKAASEEIVSLQERIKNGQVDWITFTSSSTITSFFSQIDSDTVNSSGVKIASIGPFTTKQLRTCGREPDVEAATHNTMGLIEAMAGVTS